MNGAAGPIWNKQVGSIAPKTLPLTDALRGIAMVRILKNGSKTGRSILLWMAIAATMGLILLSWVRGNSSSHSSFEQATGGAALAVILVGWIGWISFREAMERGRAEDALQASEERFHLFAEGVHEYAIILLDREGMVVSWNAGAERAKGYKAEQIIGRSFSVFYPPEDVAAGIPAMELRRATKEGRWEGNGWRVRADGSRFWANVLITALKDDAGNLRGFSKLTRDITERKQAEEALLKAGALQNAIFNSANFSSIATDAKGIIQIFNVGAERMLGYTAAEVMNKITPADISDPREIIARAEALSLERGTPITPGFEALVFKASRGIEDIYELTYVRKDGSRFPAVVSVTALRDAQDVIIGYLLIGTDNTARKRAEEALLKAGALQSAIFNSANFSSIATDAKGVIQIFNVGAEHMLGYTAAEVMNKITPADISDPQEIIARAAALSLERGTPITPGFEALVFKASRGIEDIYELTYVRKDGSRFPAVVSVTALRDAEDVIIGYLLIGTDNTARRQADEALRKNEAQLETIIENLDEGVVVSDLKGELLHANHAALELYGQEWYGRVSLDQKRPHLGQFSAALELSGVYGTVLPKDEWPLARILRGEKLRGVEVRIRRVDTDWQRVFSYGGTLVQDARGQPLMAVVTISDITERRRAADVIYQLNTDLERRVVERTAQLQTANSELEAFCYSVSHDLRAPLRSLDGFSLALIEDYADKLDAQGQKYLSRIRAGSQRMGQLIDDLLNLSRVSRGETSSESVDLSKMAHEVVEELQASAPLRQAEFVIAEGLMAETDPRLLRIVLTNLFGNAWKFTAKQARPRIEFGCSGENGDAEYFMRDNGAGFDQAYSSKLFGVFQRLHAVSDFPGTGIGLATVQRIINRQGGRVWAEGKVEQGATFHFTLATRHEPPAALNPAH
jgi:PAS domain S-box-containing protein